MRARERQRNGNWREVIEGGAQIAVAVLTSPLSRHWYNRWGATHAETRSAMPGDELVPRPKLTSTRAITISAPPEQVWAWLVQIGQGRGGLYSFDALENLLHCDMHSADRVIAGLQHLRPGDLILLAPAEAPCYRVAKVEPPRVLVLAGADPKTRTMQPCPATDGQMGTTWQWVLRRADGGLATRLMARQRYTYPRSQSVLWHLVEPVDFVMERRMLRGIKRRAEAGGTGEDGTARLAG